MNRGGGGGGCLKGKMEEGERERIMEGEKNTVDNLCVIFLCLV